MKNEIKAFNFVQLRCIYASCYVFCLLKKNLMILKLRSYLILWRRENEKKHSTHIFFASVLFHSFLFIKFCFPLFEYIFTIQKHGERKYDGWIKMSHRIHQLIHSEKLKASLPLMSEFDIVYCYVTARLRIIIP